MSVTVALAGSTAVSDLSALTITRGQRWSDPVIPAVSNSDRDNFKAVKVSVSLRLCAYPGLAERQPTFLCVACVGMGQRLLRMGASVVIHPHCAVT